MRVFLSRLITYTVLLFCGVYVLMEITRGRSIEVRHTPAVLKEDWRAKRVLFGTGLLPPGEMRTICFNKTLMSRHSQYPLIQKNPLYHIPQTFYLCKKFNMLVCSVPKAGSIFWTTTMAAITGAGKDVNDALPRDSIHSTLGTEMKVDYDTIKKTFNGFKIITARNPFTRLFSAYIDMVFLPTNWVLSTDIRDKVKGRIESGHFCLNDLTFSDFLLFVTKNYNAYSNAHWVPVTSLCEPCDNNTILVVREENFVNDTREVLNKVGLPEIRVNTLTSILEKDYAKQTQSIVGTLLDKTFLYKKHFCLSSVDILKRIWKSLQIQGRISSFSLFPEKIFDEISLKTLKSKFKSAVSSAISLKQMTPEKIRNQRTGEVIEEYKTIHPGIIEDIRKIYYNDFALFNYSMHAPTRQTLT